jgi:trans-aconitate 2-methyltransferase
VFPKLLSRVAPGGALANDEQRAGFTAQYLERIRRAYPVRGNGRVIFPFRRLFLIAYQRP